MMYKKLKSYNINFESLKKPPFFKVAFSLLELIFVIVLIAIISSTLIPKTEISKLQMATDKIVLYLNYTRYIAMIDNKYDINEDKWHKERWTIRFQECTNEKEDGLYYMIYSDTNHGGQPNKEECLKDPLTNKYIYSHYCDEDTVGDKSQYVFLKQFGIVKVEVSCYSQGSTEKTIGKISFGNDGKIYSKLTSDINNVIEITEQCTIKLFDKEDNFTRIAIEPKTGYIHKL